MKLMMMGDMNQKIQKPLFTCEICFLPLKLSINNKFIRCMHPICGDCIVKYDHMKLKDIKYPSDQQVDDKTCQQLDRWENELFESLVLKHVESPFIVKGNKWDSSQEKKIHRVVNSDVNRLMRF